MRCLVVIAYDIEENNLCWTGGKCVGLKLDRNRLCQLRLQFMDFALKMLKLCLVTSDRAFEITNLIGLELERAADPHGREMIHREDD
jgi:hypothetical protein